MVVDQARFLRNHCVCSLQPVNFCLKTMLCSVLRRAHLTVSESVFVCVHVM